MLFRTPLKMPLVQDPTLSFEFISPQYCCGILLFMLLLHYGMGPVCCHCRKPCFTLQTSSITVCDQFFKNRAVDRKYFLLPISSCYSLLPCFICIKHCHLHASQESRPLKMQILCMHVIINYPPHFARSFAKNHNHVHSVDFITMLILA